MRTSGFTLIEMIVVISIVAILAAIAVPSFSTLLEGRRVRTDAEQVRDLLVRARQEALQRNAPVTVTSQNNVVTAAIPAFGASAAVELARLQAKGAISNGTVTLNGSGRTATPTTFVFSPAHLACKSAGGTISCFSVQVLTGGAVRLCDSALATGATGACL